MVKLTIMLLSAVLLAMAVDLPTRKYLNLAAIKTLAAAAEAEMHKRNVEVTICIVDESGNLLFLQKADGRFYPDFLCQLPGSDGKSGPVLAVEYKGGDRWAAAEDDRLIGGLWADLSGGRCRFIMIKDRQWDWIGPLLN